MAQHQTAGTRRRPSTQSRWVVAVAAVSFLAWITLLHWQESPYSHRFSHQSLGGAQVDATLALSLIAGWLLMVIAMMLPTALPFLLVFQRGNQLRAGLPWLSTLLLVGYLLSWLLFGVTIYAIDWLLHQVLHTNVALAPSVPMLGGLTLLVAGVYQLTPLKRRSLEACAAQKRCCTVLDDQVMGGVRQALLAGLRHGWCCVGCCWALMLLMFVAGTHSLGWMVGLSAVMTVEKWAPRGWLFAVPLGVTLLIWGALLVLGGFAPVVQPHRH